MTSRWVCYLFAAFMSVAALAIGMVEVFFLWQVKPKLQIDIASQQKYFQAYVDDQQFLKHSSLVKFKKIGQNDAGLFLNEKLFWTPLPEASHTLKQPLVAVLDRESLLRFRSEWMKKFDRVRFMKADLSVFTGLQRFDYWDIEQNSPIADLLEKHHFVPPPKLPVPETSDLLAITQIRLMGGAASGDFVAALSDVRQLALLLLTTENTQLMMTGLVALDYERFAYRYFVEDRKMDPTLWTPIDQNITRRAHRALLGTESYLQLWTLADTFENIFLSDEPPIGFCSSFNDMMPMDQSLRSRLEPSWPIEISLKSNYERLDQALKRARLTCRLRYLGDLLDHNSIRTNVPGPLILNRIPYARKIFGLRISILKFPGFAAYENTAN